MAAYSFTERGAHEAGFSEVFHERLVPILERHEAEREGLKRKAQRWMAGMGVAGVGGVGAGLGFEQEMVGIMSGAFGGIGAFGAKSVYEKRWQSGLGREILPILCEFLGEMRYGEQRVSPAPFERLGCVPNFHRSSLEDPVTGTHKGLDWAVTEATLSRRSRDSKGRTKTTTVFRGLLFQIAVDNPAPRIFFGRDRGSMLNWLSESLSSSRAGLEKIEVPDAEFERIYEVYADDPQAARDYITPGLVAGLKLVAEHEVGESYVGCAFEGNWFYIALPRSRGFLSLGSLFRPTHDIEEDLHAALWDLDMPRRVIDALTGR